MTDTKDRLAPGTQNTFVLSMGLSEAVPGFKALLNVPSELDTIVKQKPTDTKGIYPGEQFLNKAFDFPAEPLVLHVIKFGQLAPNNNSSLV